jgi:hypothetical protein
VARSGDEGTLSAQVILNDAGAASEVSEFFATAGFETGPFVGTSFAITGPRERFEDIFGAAAASSLAETRPVELSPSTLPDDVAGAIAAIAIGGPPDFGPP